MLEHANTPAAKRPRTSSMPEIPCRCLALVACDWRRQGSSDRKLSDDELKNKMIRGRKKRTGLSTHFAEIIRIASERGADTILFSPWSHTVNKDNPRELRHAELFPAGTTHQVVILGVRRWDGKEYKEKIEVHARTGSTPYQMEQHFASAKDEKQQKEDFMEDLPIRTNSGTSIFICGETNIVGTKRCRPHHVKDEYGVRTWLDKNDVCVILNPVHDYMRLPAMKRQRGALSSRERVVVSVWNRGYKTREAIIPWTAHRDGKDVSDEIVELPDVCDWSAAPSEPGIRIGILKLDQE